MTRLGDLWQVLITIMARKGNAFYQRPSADKRRQGQVRDNSVFESPATNQHKGFNSIEVPCDPDVFGSQFYDTRSHPAWPSQIRLVPIERSTFSSIVSLPKNQLSAAVRQRFAAVCSASMQLAEWHTRCFTSEAANPVVAESASVKLSDCRASGNVFRQEYFA